MVGPDVYLEFDESVLNEALAGGWQTGLAAYSGRLTFAQIKSPALSPYAEADYRVTLNGEPLVDFVKEDKLYIRCDAKLELLAFTLLPITFDLAFHAVSELTFTSETAEGSTDIKNELSFKPSAVVIDRLVIRNQIKVTEDFLKALNTVLENALTTVLSSKPSVIALPSLAFNVPIPGINGGPEIKLPIRLGGVKILDNKRLAVGLVLLNDEVDELKLDTARSSAPIFIHINKASINELYNYWWSKNDWSKPVDFGGTLPLNADVFVEKSRSILTRLITLGFLQRENDVKNMKLTYLGKLSVLDQPVIDFTAPDKAVIKNIKLKGNIAVSINADVDETLYLDTSSIIPDKITPWKDDIKLKNRSGNEIILHLDKDFELDLEEAEAELSVNSEGAIVIKARKAEFKLDLGNEWYTNLPESLLNGLFKLFNQKIIDHIPALVIAPAVLLKDVRIEKLTPVITPQNIKVNSSSVGIFGEESIAFETGFDIAELAGKTPVPGYIANTRSHLVHRVTCEVIKDIRPEHREGYYVLHEAIRDGYSSCKNCLKGAVVE